MENKKLSQEKFGLIADNILSRNFNRYLANVDKNLKMKNYLDS